MPTDDEYTPTTGEVREFAADSYEDTGGWATQGEARAAGRAAFDRWYRAEAERAEATLAEVRTWAEGHARLGGWWQATEVGRAVLAILDGPPRA